MYQNDSSSDEVLERIYRGLAHDVDELSFSAPVAAVYNPLDYAWPVFRQYLQRFAGRGQVLMVGMNPGPWGMAQTGVPFGEVHSVREWMGLDGSMIGRPPAEHPKRPIEGFACGRSEVSGSRLWGWARRRYRDPAAFARRFLVLNYCPLLFLEGNGRNRTPDRLPAAEREPLLELCDLALASVVERLEPEKVVGIGNFATERCRRALRGGGPAVGSVLHPSPASPAANRGWARQAERQLADQGIHLGLRSQ